MTAISRPVAAVVASALAGLAFTTVATPPAEAATDDLRVEVSLSERELYVFRGDERVATYPVAIGRPGYPTPTGSWTIHQVDWNPDWTPPDSSWSRGSSYTPPGHPDNPMGRVRLVFHRPYSIHGTDGLDALGRAVSHGCVRLANDDVVALAPLVMEAGGAPHTEAWVDDALAHPGDMRTVHLPDPVPLIIYA